METKVTPLFAGTRELQGDLDLTFLGSTLLWEPLSLAWAIDVTDFRVVLGRKSLALQSSDEYLIK